MNAVVGHDEKFNNAIVRHALDLKDESIFRNPNAFNVTFHDMKKFDQVNPVIDKLAAQVRASQLTEKEVNQKLLDNFEADQIQARLDRLRYGDQNDDDDDDNDNGPEGGSPGGVDEELARRLRRLRGNDEDRDEREEFLRRYEQLHRNGSVPEQFFNRRISQRQKELVGLKKGAKGNVNRKRSSIEPHLKFRLPETPPPTPADEYWEGVAEEWIPNSFPLSEPPPFQYDGKDFPPLSRPPPRLPPIDSA